MTPTNPPQPPKKNPPTGASPPPAQKPAGAAGPAPKPAVAGQPPSKPPAPAGPAPARPAPPTTSQAPAKPAPAAGPTPAKQAPAAPAPQPAKPAPAGQQAPAKPGQAAPAQQPAKPAPAGQQAPAKPAQPAAGQAAKPAAPAKPPAAGSPKAPPKKLPPKKIGEVTPARGGGRRKIGQVLVDLGFLDEEQLWDILQEARDSGTLTGQVALSRGLVTDDQLLEALAELHNLKVVNLQEVKPTTEATTMVPETMATVYKILPLSVKDNVLTIAMSDPSNLAALDDMKNLLGVKEVQAVVAGQQAILDAIPGAYAGKQESIVDLIQSLEDDPTIGKLSKETSIDLESLQELQDAAPVRKLLNMVMLLAIKDKASDIHFEPFEDEYKMRYRCDGVLYEMVPPPRHLSMAISTRIKVMSNLDIAERRLPQDGRIELNVGGNPVDMRVSVLPTLFGESVVIRVLDRTVVSLDLNKVGLEAETLARFREMIRKPNGIVLITGPTGAGKTTTLYSALNELNDVSEKIITTEDPIEYDLDGIIQIPINPDIQVTFANCLRAILRHDPDKILVGEIRDLETAQIAVQAALTGHIVFTTLHTNDAPSSIVRLRDMGLEPYLITATLEGVMAQRLVRRICLDCRTEYEPSPELLMELNLRPEDVAGQKFFYGRGCDRCNNTGYRGRCGIYELMPMNDELRDLITSGVSSDQLRASARRMGMSTLREAGLRAIYNGITTIDEVVRETVLEEDE